MKKYFFITVCCVFFFYWPTSASDLVEALPLTDQIIMLHFDDGYVEHPGYDQLRKDAVVHKSALSIEKAILTTSYEIVSQDDAAYQTAKNPLRIGRKTKANDFSRIWPPIQDHIKEHWIYLVLPVPMQRGKNYTILVNGLADNVTEISIVFDEFKTRSEAIHVNQLGFARKDRKFAYISHWMGDIGGLNLDDYVNNFFYVYDLDNQEPVYAGKVKKRKDFETGIPETDKLDQTINGSFTGSDVLVCEFTSCPSPGNMVLVVEGIGCSFPFEIGKDPVREAFKITCRGLFHERAGIDKTAPYTKWNLKADHNGQKGYPLYYTAFRFMDSQSEGADFDKVKKMVKGKIETWGWYHDAGDWDGYPTHQCIPSYLMTVYEFSPQKYVDGELNIPESGNGIPDILDEAMWLLNFFKRTKELAKKAGYATGGIPGSRVHGDFHHKPDGKPSWEDDRDWYVFGEESRTTFRYAGQTAQLAYCLDLAGKNDIAKEWLKEAVEAYQWAENNTRPGDDISRSRMFAAAWLYKYTGKDEYQKQFLSDNTIKKFSKENIQNSPNRNYLLWAIWAYVTTSQNSIDKTTKETLTKMSLWWADTLDVNPAATRGIPFAAAYGMPVIVGQATTPLCFHSVVAHHISGDDKYLNTIQAAVDYSLGGNPLNMCWVTGLGDRYPKQILHLDSWYDDKEQMVPGQIPYGPNRLPNRGDRGFNGPWDSDMGNALVYPDESLWPAHELYFENRYCPITNEYTVHQNIGPAAAIFAYLCNKPKK